MDWQQSTEIVKTEDTSIKFLYTFHNFPRGSYTSLSDSRKRILFQIFDSSGIIERRALRWSITRYRKNEHSSIWIFISVCGLIKQPLVRHLNSVREAFNQPVRAHQYMPGACQVLFLHCSIARLAEMACDSQFHLLPSSLLMLVSDLVAVSAAHKLQRPEPDCRLPPIDVQMFNEVLKCVACGCDHDQFWPASTRFPVITAEFRTAGMFELLGRIHGSVATHICNCEWWQLMNTNHAQMRNFLSNFWTPLSATLGFGFIAPQRLSRNATAMAVHGQVTSLSFSFKIFRDSAGLRS